MQKVTARIFSPEKDNIKERLVGIGLGIAGEGDTKPNIILYLKPEMIPEEFRELVNVTYEKIPTITEQIPPPYPFDHPVPMAYIDYETLNSHLRPIIETLRYGNRKGKTRTTKDHIMFIENDPETIDQAEQVLNNYHLIVTPDHQSAIDYLDEVVRTDDQPDLIIIRKKNYPNYKNLLAQSPINLI